MQLTCKQDKSKELYIIVAFQSLSSIVILNVFDCYVARSIETMACQCYHHFPYAYI